MMKKNAKNFAVGLICLILCFVVAQTSVLATEGNQSAASSNNIGAQNYSVKSECVNSSLYQSGSEQFTRVEALSTGVVIETYDSDFRFLTSKTISLELDIFGGFYSGEDYNFLVYGQENPSEDDGQEVIRVVKYTKDWERLGYASLYGANTTIPFTAGSLRCAEYNGMLYIRTSHQMYKSSDGLNHQANLTMSIRQSDMSITDSYYIVMNSSYGYVSHSFNQFIMVDTNNNLVALDHGDAYPRSAVLMKYNKKAGETTFTGSTSNVNVLAFQGDIGDNLTGASLGGLSESASSYLVAGNCVIQDSSFASRITRNVFATVTNKDTYSTNNTQLVLLTNYEEDSTYSASTPHLVKISDDRFLVMWSQLDSSTLNNRTNNCDSGILCYVFIDGEGNKISDIYTTEGSLSDCAPILVDDEITWYVTDNSKPVFYSINTLTGELKVSTHTITAAAQADGSISPSGDIAVASGESQTFTITAKNGYKISDVIVDGKSVGSVSTFTFDDVTEDHSISAEFAAISPELNITNNTAYIQGYDDGTVRPEAQITREEVASIFYRLLSEESRAYFETSANDFSDVDSGRWSNTAISTLANAGVLNGYEGKFRPSDPITRAELVKIVISIKGVSEGIFNNPFTDVSGHWADSYILAAANEGWITGYDDGTFRPDKNIIRAEAMTMVNRVLGRENSDISKITDMKTWLDNADTIKWYYNAVQIATNSY